MIGARRRGRNPSGGPGSSFTSSTEIRVPGSHRPGRGGSRGTDVSRRPRWSGSGMGSVGSVTVGRRRGVGHRRPAIDGGGGQREGRRTSVCLEIFETHHLNCVVVLRFQTTNGHHCVGFLSKKVIATTISTQSDEGCDGCFWIGVNARITPLGAMPRATATTTLPPPSPSPSVL